MGTTAGIVKYKVLNVHRIELIIRIRCIINDDRLYYVGRYTFDELVFWD